MVNIQDIRNARKSFLIEDKIQNRGDYSLFEFGWLIGLQLQCFKLGDFQLTVSVLKGIAARLNYKMILVC